jgi:DnaK suppressor protein
MNEYIMDNKQKAKLKENIQDKLKTIKEDIASYELLTKPVSPDNAIGRLTRMEAINSKSINEAALRKARDTRSQLERALAKIDTPDFGLCRECDEPIPSARLMILPETDLCVKCAENING